METITETSWITVSLARGFPLCGAITTSTQQVTHPIDALCCNITLQQWQSEVFDFNDGEASVFSPTVL